MSTTAEIVRPQSEASSNCHAMAHSEDLIEPSLALNPVERMAVSELLTGDARSLVAHVAQRATALASDDGPLVLRRSLARAVAVAEAQMHELSALLAAAVAKRDESGAKLLERQVNSATQRFRLLADQLLATFQGGRRSVLVVGQAGSQVSITAKE